MEATEQIKKFGEFFEQNYKDELLVASREETKVLKVDFSSLSRFDPELAEMLLDQPEEVVKAAEIAIEQYDLGSDVKVRVKALPESRKVDIRDIRSKHIGKLLLIEGVVRQKSDVRPQVTSAKFECPNCGNVINVLQLDSTFKEPTRCGCGRKGKFRMISKELVDAQGIVLEESPENLEGGMQPKRMNVLLKDDLVSPLTEKKTNPGSKIAIVGVVAEVPIITRTGSKSTRFDLIIEANNVEVSQESFLDIKISEEDEERIKEISADPKVYDRLVGAMAPSIYGYEKIKLALLIQLMGGVRKVRKDKVVSRGDMHILLVGDPGAGKCTDGETKIMLDDGEICTMKSLYEMGNSFKIGRKGEMKVHSLNERGKYFSSQPVRFFRRKSPKHMLKIITQTGNELVVTKEHPIFTTNGGLVFSKMADEFKVGEYIATASKVEVKGSLQPISKDIQKSRANRQKKYSFPDILNLDLARYIGYLVGDGMVRFTDTSGAIRFSNSNKEVLDDFEGLTKKLFGCGLKKARRKNDCYDYRWFSVEAVRILEKMCPSILKKSGGVRIPAPICKSPDYVVKEFIKSLFECEAYISDKKREIEFSTKSKDLVYDIKYILLRFGIVSQVSSALKYATNTVAKVKRNYYRLRISGKNTLVYLNNIGFVSQSKNKRLKRLTSLGKGLNTNLNIIPGLKDVLKILRKKYGISQFSFGMSRSSYQHYEKGDRYPSYEKLKIICNKYEELDGARGDPLVSMITQLSESDIFWDKIRAIEVVCPRGEYVYDVEIERVHNFVANCAVIHNSALIKRVGTIAPKGIYVTGKGASGAGLTASVVKDEFLKGWSLEAGAMVLASGGICVIDEMDKMSREDASAMHEALENQTVSISKANIQATLIAQTTVLGAANPKFGRFDPYAIVGEQIDMVPTLINRFDLIFTIKDLPDEARDKALASHILGLHKDPDSGEAEITTDFLKKYIAYAKQNCKPALTDEALKEIHSYYVKMRMSGGGEGGIKTVPISARQLEALVRMSEASAKIRLSDKVQRKDAKRAIDLLQFCLMEVGFDKETGKIDIDRIATGVGASQRSQISTVKDIISTLEGKFGKAIPIDEVVNEAKIKGIAEDKVEETIERLKRLGDVFEPRHGFVSKI